MLSRAAPSPRGAFRAKTREHEPGYLLHLDWEIYMQVKLWGPSVLRITKKMGEQCACGIRCDGAHNEDSFHGVGMSRHLVKKTFSAAK